MSNIDLFNSFNTLANAPGWAPPSIRLPIRPASCWVPSSSRMWVSLRTTRLLACWLLTSKSLLQAAAGILAVEAYHTGSIRTRIYAASATAQAASQKIATARAALSAAGRATAKDDVGVGNDSSGAARIVHADANGITFARNTEEVLSIVYGGGKGGAVFHPNGQNGTIK
jgi:hypothetical protein